MKGSLVNADDRNAILARISTLTPESTRLWGTMNVSQMLAHCQQGIKTARGEMQLKRSVVGFLFGKMAKKQLLKETVPFKKNLPTENAFRIKHQPEFEAEKQKLVNLINSLAGGMSEYVSGKHPFFGNMTAEEWDYLQWKHLDHHLRQFGA